VLIVIILAIIAGVGMFMYLRATESNARAQMQVDAAREDTVMLSRVARLPELSCSRDRSQTNCIDAEKAKAFSVLAADQALRTKYFPLFGASKITIERVGTTTEKIVVYDALEGSDVRATRTYFTVFDPTSKTTDFAVMIIEREP
jgi:hypothetical protein